MDALPFAQETGRAAVGTGNLALTAIRSPNRPAACRYTDHDYQGACFMARQAHINVVTVMTKYVLLRVEHDCFKDVYTNKLPDVLIDWVTN